MFTLKTQRFDGSVLESQGESGEGWMTFLFRLHQKMTGDSGPPSFALPSLGRPFKDDPIPGSGKGVAVLYREAGHPAGLSHPVEFVSIETDPPQF